MQFESSHSPSPPPILGSEESDSILTLSEASSPEQEEILYQISRIEKHLLHMYKSERIDPIWKDVVAISKATRAIYSAAIKLDRPTPGRSPQQSLRRRIVLLDQ